MRQGTGDEPGMGPKGSRSSSEYLNLSIHTKSRKRDPMSRTVERTDFVSVPVQDMQRAKAFYRDTLSMHSPDWDASWPEIETGNVSLYLVDPTAMGTEFAPHTAPLALRVADVAAAKQDLETRGVEFTGEQDTGVCKMAFFSDTEGNALMLHRRYAS
jgi:predicted enzyme related to lactoylglutathione lyase